MNNSGAKFDAALAGRYTLERELGHGGMATVWLARDLKHDRPVALKVLRPELAAALGPERFLREITVTAGLQHPHILPLLDSGEVAGRLFYVMPYVEGESLRDRLNREQQLPLEDSLHIAREVADALSYAHCHDVVHRDIKPENILLESGHAVVADFGIAKALTAAGGDRLTETGIAVGTPAYMSPEQAAGSRDVDGRSDLYSLGCVLYEMLSGETPYTGPTPQAIIAKKLSEPTPRISVVRETVPAEVEAALTTALAKNPADRFRTAEQFSQALTMEAVGFPRRQRTGTNIRRTTLTAAALAVLAMAAVVWGVRQQRISPRLDSNVIAVMPLRITGPDTSVRYLREGVLDILYVKLQGDGGPRALDARLVLNRLRQLVGETGDLSPEQALALARRLGAGRVLLGEVVASPAAMLLNARLLRVPDGQVVAEQASSRRPGESELQVLDRVLGAVLAGAAGERAERLESLSDSLTAVQAYLAGMRAARRQEYIVATREFTRALEIDSTFAVAALRRAVTAGLTLDADLVKTGRDGAWALRDRLSARDRAVLIATVGPRYPKASTGVEHLAASEQAARLAPDDPRLWMNLGLFRAEVGRSRGEESWAERAAAAYDRAIALDSTDAEVLETALWFAIEVRDTARVRRLEQAWLGTVPTGEWVDGTRWLSAVALGDSAAVAALRARFDQIDLSSIHAIVYGSIMYGLPLDGLLELLLQRTVREGRPLASGYGLDLAMVEGRVTLALAIADSLGDQGIGVPLGARRAIVQQAITDPGYEEAALAGGNWLRAVADTAHTPDALCWSTIWRAFRGDTVEARESIARIRVLVGDRDNLPGPRVSRFDMCPRLLEAMLEQAAPHPASHAALDWIDSLTSQGLSYSNALPFNIAGLLIAQWRERRGDLRGARAALHRRPVGWSPPKMTAFPTSLREEGRLSAMIGDTAGAIRAYTHYLTLRTHPDPGPMADEVRRVKEHLALLVRRAGSPGIRR